MKTLAVIPARLGASRLPRKPLRLVGGVPLVVRVWERVSEMRVADQVVVATDSDEIAAALRQSDATVELTSDAHPSGTDRVAEVAARPRYADFDAVVNVQGDEPFVSDAAVRGATGIVTSGRFPLGTAAAPLAEHMLATPHVVKVVIADDGRALYFSRAPIPWLREPVDAPTRDGVARQHIGVYAYTREALAAWVSLPQHPLERIERLEQLRPLAAGYAMGVAVVSELPIGGVDTEDDLARANARWRELSAERA
ncbi:MAG TPA: 3-deoxy-manno-octulosonate cytidylyltransferase [Gemmatimonadaceae bacterium]|nr:3-deoxy-manno-octulosonate cytidylyltransferase [Gemmatimonadaceae bacterium]